jgi:hypothetical protein
MGGRQPRTARQLAALSRLGSPPRRRLSNQRRLDPRPLDPRRNLPRRADPRQLNRADPRRHLPRQADLLPLDPRRLKPCRYLPRRMDPGRRAAKRTPPALTRCSRRPRPNPGRPGLAWVPFSRNPRFRLRSGPRSAGPRSALEPAATHRVRARAGRTGGRLDRERASPPLRRQQGSQSQANLAKAPLGASPRLKASPAHHFSRRSRSVGPSRRRRCARSAPHPEGRGAKSRALAERSSLALSEALRRTLCVPPAEAPPASAQA